MQWGYLQIVTPLGGALNLLYQLKHSAPSHTMKSAEKPDKGILGKLDIKWRTTMGDVGRLQTQPISVPAAGLKDICIQVSTNQVDHQFIRCA